LGVVKGVEYLRCSTEDQKGEAQCIHGGGNTTFIPAVENQPRAKPRGCALLLTVWNLAETEAPPERMNSQWDTLPLRGGIE